MNRKLFLAFLSVLPLATGCVINHGPQGGGGAQPGDVTFSWTFAGQDCSAVPDVQSVRITIPGEALQNNGVYPCTANGYPGIVLHDFAGGPYSYTIEGLDYAGQTIYSASGTFGVNGSVLVTVDLTPVGSPGSYAYLTWTFPPQQGVTQPCTDRGLAYVYVQIDAMAAQRYDCNVGLGAPGAQTPLIAPGDHTISVWATDANNYKYYSVTSALTTYSSSPTSQQYDLQWAVGGAAVSWSMSNTGGSSVTCGQSGTTTMYVNFLPVGGGAPLYGPVSDPTQWDRIDNYCAQYTYLYWSYLPPGTYYVYMRAVGTSTVYDNTYTTGGYPTVQVTITAGSFPGQAQAQTVPMVQTQ